MSDWTDEASNLQEQQTEIALQAQRARAAQHEAALGAASGKCLNCEEKLEEGRFCDEFCREDFQKRMKVRRPH